MLYDILIGEARTPSDGYDAITTEKVWAKRVPQDKLGDEIFNALAKYPSECVIVEIHK